MRNVYCEKIGEIVSRIQIDVAINIFNVFHLEYFIPCSVRSALKSAPPMYIGIIERKLLLQPENAANAQTYYY